VGPPLFFGLRFWASICPALYVAFWLQLDNVYWAGTMAAFVHQPQLGASLRKARSYVIGTVLGALIAVVLAGRFPQDLAAFLTCLALVGAGSAFVAALLHSFASFAAALTGITVAIITCQGAGWPIRSGCERSPRRRCEGWTRLRPARRRSGCSPTKRPGF
jgi:uncharacterized membrane protein YccC